MPTPTIRQTVTGVNLPEVAKQGSLKVYPSQFGTGYAKNIWDMISYNNKIYIAQGDSGSNAGPIPLNRFDPLKKNFINEYTVNSEQINEFTILNGELCIPDHDTRSTVGSFYKLANGLTWTEMGDIAGALHTYGICYYDGKYFTANDCSASGTHNSLAISSDGGATWTSAYNWSIPQTGFVSVFEFLGNVYAVSSINALPYGALLDVEYVQKFNSGTSKFVQDIGTDVICPGVTHNLYSMDRITKFDSKLAYILTLGGFQRNPVALIKTTNMVDSFTKVTIPNSALPSDMIVRGSTLYLLSYVRNAIYNYTIYVHSTTDLTNFTQVMTFSADTLARSFEELNGDFYFGMGCKTSEVTATTGTILRYSKMI